MNLTTEERVRLEALIRRSTRRLRPILTPELEIWGADDYAEIWSATEETLRAEQLAPPFWAFAWPGGQALARHLLDHPEIAAGSNALALFAGAGLEALAAAKTGARRATVNDIDPAALLAAEMNAALNDVALETCGDDLLADDSGGESRFGATDLLLVGDGFYEQTTATRLEAMLRRAAASGALVLLGDPDRRYLPRSGLEKLAEHRVPTPVALEDAAERVTAVYRLLP